LLASLPFRSRLAARSRCTMGRLGELARSRPPVKLCQRLKINIVLAADIDGFNPSAPLPAPKGHVADTSVAGHGLRCPQTASCNWLAAVAARNAMLCNVHNKAEL
jgi:hypothetical protein